MTTPLDLQEFLDQTDTVSKNSSSQQNSCYCSALQGEHRYWCQPDFNDDKHDNSAIQLIKSYSPIDNRLTSELVACNQLLASELVDQSVLAFQQWRIQPAPLRGQLVKKISKLVEQYKVELAAFLTLETGKTQQEALGEVQEWIDMCDFAIGLSRQLHGLTISSERPFHHMRESWHPLGPVAVISAFNFPIAVWAWNAMLAFICGDSVIWKGSEQTPLCSLACAKIVNLAIEECNFEVPFALHTLIMGDKSVGQWLADDERIPLVSATGSVAMGQDVSRRVGQRLGRSLLELSGNNALIISKQSNLKLAVRAVLFSAIGTSGQRCTSLRRLIIHHDIAEQFIAELISSYQSIQIGDPRDEAVHLGPIINQTAFDHMQSAIAQGIQQGGVLLYGGKRLLDAMPEGGVYVQPAIMEIDSHAEIIQQETFAPLLFVIRYQDFEQAIAINNNSMMGLSSALFSNNLQECELFLSSSGSDCGITNINIGTSGAEIGGAFGGEKKTGGGRESGSDAWKNYMRRATNTINYGNQLPLAQGIKF
jgi:aldehyde dehydrogenase (NAD+)